MRYLLPKALFFNPKTWDRKTKPWDIYPQD